MSLARKIGAILGAAGGSQTHTLVAGQMAPHSHPVTDPGHVHSGPVTPGAGGSYGSGDNGYATNTGSASTGITVGNNTGGGAAHPNVQPTIILNWVIKT